MGKRFVIFMLSLVFLAGCSSAFKQVQQNPYEVISDGSTRESYLFVKYSRSTGQTWILTVKGWQPITDDEVLPKSNYMVKIVSLEDYRYSAIRINTATGQSWSSINNRWVELVTKKE